MARISDDVVARAPAALGDQRVGVALHRPTLEAARNDLVRHATHMEYDCPSDVPEPCGQWCNICNRHIDDADHTKGHADACTIAKLNDILALGDGGGDGWQTIDSAPKDGTPFLAYWLRTDGEGNRYEAMCPYVVGQYYKINDVLRLAPSSIIKPDDMPTHWRPLPSPPSVPQLQPDSTGEKHG